MNYFIEVVCKAIELLVTCQLVISGVISATIRKEIRLRVVSNFGDGDCGAGKLILFLSYHLTRFLLIPLTLASLRLSRLNKFS